MTCVSCAEGGHVSSDTQSCSGCGRQFCDWCLTVDDAGCWCETCREEFLRESLAAVGGRQLIEAEVRLNREAREQEGVL